MEHSHEQQIKEFKIIDELDDENNVIKILENPEKESGTSSIIWECGIILGKYAVKQNLLDKRFNGKRILELGSGTGLLAILLASMGNIVYATDVLESLDFLYENVQRNENVFKKNGNVKCLNLDWNLDKSLLKNVLVQANIDNIDYIFASDVIFNKKHLEIFPKVLKNIVLVLEEINPGSQVPLVYMSHKARNPDIDDILAETFENLGFFGEQVEEEDMNPSYISKRIDIFMLNYETN